MEAKMEGRWKRRGRNKSIRNAENRRKRKKKEEERKKKMERKRKRKRKKKDFCPCLAWKKR
jgi:hypothetical protein